MFETTINENNFSYTVTVTDINVSKQYEIVYARCSIRRKENNREWNDYKYNVSYEINNKKVNIYLQCANINKTYFYDWSFNNIKENLFEEVVLPSLIYEYNESRER